MISKQRIFILWLIMQCGSMLSLFFGVEAKTLVANAFFSGLFMLLLIIEPSN